MNVIAIVIAGLAGGFLTGIAWLYEDCGDEHTLQRIGFVIVVCVGAFLAGHLVYELSHQQRFYDMFGMPLPFTNL